MKIVVLKDKNLKENENLKVLLNSFKAFNDSKFFFLDANSNFNDKEVKKVLLSSDLLLPFSDDLSNQNLINLIANSSPLALKFFIDFNNSLDSNKNLVQKIDVINKLDFMVFDEFIDNSLINKVSKQNQSSNFLHFEKDSKLSHYSNGSIINYNFKSNNNLNRVQNNITFTAGLIYDYARNGSLPESIDFASNFVNAYVDL